MTRFDPVLLFQGTLDRLDEHVGLRRFVALSSTFTPHMDYLGGIKLFLFEVLSTMGILL
jgi:hypothetical protein